MARNSKVNKDIVVEESVALVPVETTNKDGNIQESSLLTSETRIETEDYTRFLSVAEKLSEYTPTISITSKYYEFTEIGEKVRGVFLGTTTIKKKDDTGELIDLECIQWLAKDGSLYVNAGTALVSTFRQFLPKGCPIEITFESKKDRTKLYNVRILTE